MSAERIRSSIEAYVAAWNEDDADKRRALIEEACSEDLRIVAPSQVVIGRAALDALIVDFHHRRPGDRGFLSSSIEIHHQAFRFAAKIEGSSVAAPVEMLDAGECDVDGKIRLILSFVGAAPPAATA
jgi:hypothetical protein